MDPLRDQRSRLSLMIGLLPRFPGVDGLLGGRRARIRCQYSFDEAQILTGSGEAHTVWVTLELEPPVKGN